MNLIAAITAYFFDKHDLTAHTRRDYEQKLRAWAAWTVAHTCERHLVAARQLEGVDTGQLMRTE